MNRKKQVPELVEGTGGGALVPTTSSGTGKVH